MNRLQKIQLQASDVREQMGAILDKEEKTAEDHEMLATLSKRSQNLELETRSAIHRGRRQQGSYHGDPRRRSEGTRGVDYPVKRGSGIRRGD